MIVEVSVYQEQNLIYRKKTKNIKNFNEGLIWNHLMMI